VDVGAAHVTVGIFRDETVSTTLRAAVGLATDVVAVAGELTDWAPARVAVTVTVTAWFGVRPVTVTVPRVPLTTTRTFAAAIAVVPARAVAVYATPDTAVKVKLTDDEVSVDRVSVGANGAVAATDAAEYAEAPSPLIAATRNSYDWSAVNPVTVTDGTASVTYDDQDGAPTTRYCTV
jgi:hypothetical protein